MIKLSRLSEHRSAMLVVVLFCLMCQNFNLCSSLNCEGLALLRFRDRLVSGPFGALSNWKNGVGVIDPCSWWGVACSGGKVVALNIGQTAYVAHRRMLATASAEPPITHESNLSPSPSPSLSPLSSPSPSPAPVTVPTPKPTFHIPNVSASPPSITESRGQSVTKSSSKNHHTVIVSAAVGGSALFIILVVGLFFYRGNKVATVKPWATGLSGQLQKAFVTGVPKLKRSELQTACEDFSNVIGSSSIGTVNKGTLSSGVEIAVISVAITSAKEWSKNLEAQFRNKIDKLSKVNHKNFVNLIGYCKEEEPFTRMMVFEYAPNGTLFEHLHIKESEHLDWLMRMRIAMGMAYCLDHMHQLTPPMAHKNLTSSAVYLTEDYAARISDFGFWNEVSAAEMESNPESNVYSFGVMLFELITGRLPFAVDSGSLEDWASDYLSGDRPPGEMADPTLKSFQIGQLENISDVIRFCVHPNPKQRPSMREVTARLREITGIAPDGAIPKLSALWWAELEIMSTETC